MFLLKTLGVLLYLVFILTVITAYQNIPNPQPGLGWVAFGMIAAPALLAAMISAGMSSSRKAREEDRRLASEMREIRRAESKRG